MLLVLSVSQTSSWVLGIWRCKRQVVFLILQSPKSWGVTRLKQMNKVQHVFVRVRWGLTVMVWGWVVWKDLWGSTGLGTIWGRWKSIHGNSEMSIWETILMSVMTRAETGGEGHDEISEVGEVLWKLKMLKLIIITMESHCRVLHRTMTMSFFLLFN